MSGFADAVERRCLVADDSRIVRRVSARILSDLGFSMVEAATAAEALDQCRLDMPDAVLLDIHIAPEVHNGLQVIAAIRALPGGKDAKIIVCTTERAPANIMRALDAGADEYIMKPFDSDIVASKFVLTGLVPAQTLAAEVA